MLPGTPKSFGEDAFVVGYAEWHTRGREGERLVKRLEKR
jgi:hypothetical protein